MTLSIEDREKVRTGLARYWSRFWITTGLNKLEMLAAVVATDQWIDDNQASYNSALPEEARNDMLLAQKTFLFCIVAAARVSIGFLRKMVGGVD